ncbi:hypothetical protein [Oceanobacillus sp. FSL W7-1293]|uniref:hypothetical protein n=1 Tax=Oceanobacillus sp. FSL W7-1293 TaxID=2921699 RepID=UPI0030CC5FB1
MMAKYIVTEVTETSVIYHVEASSAKSAVNKAKHGQNVTSTKVDFKEHFVTHLIEEEEEEK